MAIPESDVITLELARREGARLRWAPAQEGAESPRSPWLLESEPDWRLLDSIRLVSASFDDGTALGVASLRPRGARGHGDDVVIARLVDTEGQETQPSETLVSVEHDADGVPRRLGLELWTDPDSSPMRAAADRTDEAAPGAGTEREAVSMRFRLDGMSGTGRLETIRPG